MLKRFLSGSIAAAFLLSNTAFAADVNVTLNDEGVVFANQEPVIVEGRVLVPLRGVFEMAGYNVEWDSQTKTAVLSNSENKVVITAGNTDFTVNGDTVKSDVAPQIINGSMMIPLRAVGDGIGGSAAWDADTKTASVYVVPSELLKYSKDTENALAPFMNLAETLYDDLGIDEEAANEYVQNALQSNSFEGALSYLNELGITDANGAKFVNNLPAYKTAISESRQALEAVTAPDSAKGIHTSLINTLSSYEAFFDILDEYVNGAVSEADFNAAVENVAAVVDDYIKSFNEFTK